MENTKISLLTEWNSGLFFFFSSNSLVFDLSCQCVKVHRVMTCLIMTHSFMLQKVQHIKRRPNTLSYITFFYHHLNLWKMKRMNKSDKVKEEDRGKKLRGVNPKKETCI